MIIAIIIFAYPQCFRPGTALVGHMPSRCGSLFFIMVCPTVSRPHPTEAPNVQHFTALYTVSIGCSAGGQPNESHMFLHYIALVTHCFPSYCALVFNNHECWVAFYRASLDHNCTTCLSSRSTLHFRDHERSINTLEAFTSRTFNELLASFVNPRHKGSC